MARQLIAYLPATEATAAFPAIDKMADPRAVDERLGPTGDRGPATSRSTCATSSPASWTPRLRRPTHPAPPPPRPNARTLQVTVAGLGPIPRPRRPPGNPVRLLRADPRPGRPRARPGRHLGTEIALTEPAPDRSRPSGPPGFRPQCGPSDPRSGRPRHRLHLPRAAANPPSLRDRRRRLPSDRRAAGPDRRTATATTQNLHALCKPHHQAKAERLVEGGLRIPRPVSTAWTNRRRLTYVSRRPQRIHTAPDASQRRPPPPPPPDSSRRPTLLTLPASQCGWSEPTGSGQ